MPETKEETKTFAVTWGKGFHMTFPNGVTVSVQWGPGNYCENRNFEKEREFLSKIGKGELPNDQRSNNAEIMIWNKKGDTITQEFRNAGGDYVIGWLSPIDVLEALNWAANYNS